MLFWGVGVMFWVMAKNPILVTGAAGFIGGRFVESCNHQNLPVISVDLKQHFETRQELRGISFGQIIDRDDLFDFLKSPPPLSGIVHMGACSRTTEFDEAFLQRVNVEYSQHLWNFATKHKIPFVYASSAATYGSLGESDDDESCMQNLVPLNPYGRSKQKFDLWALSEDRAGRKPLAWSGFKFFNVYGFGEEHKNAQSSVVYKAFREIHENGNAKLFKSHKPGIPDGQQKRDFVWIGDVLEILHFALSKPITRGIFNLGSGQARSFLDLTNAVFHSLGQTPKIEWVDTPIEIRDKYQYFTQATMNRIQAQGFTKPLTSLEVGVGATIEKLLNQKSKR